MILKAFLTRIFEFFIASNYFTNHLDSNSVKRLNIFTAVKDMPDNLVVSFVNSISDIKSSEWAEVINTDYPFIQYDFILALENSDAVSAKSGWQPFHLIVRRNNRLNALMPLYVKSHSYGEYVFDFQWANAYQQAGIEYYPKLVTAIPFTPSAGQRIYFDSAINPEEIYSQIQATIAKFSVSQHVSSWHILFPTESESLLLEGSSMIRRSGIQYQWFNQNYKNFDEFLSQCKSKARKNMKRERRLVKEQNIKVEVLSGEDITEVLWDKFFLFYQLTYLKRSGHGGYLNKAFFKRIGESMSHSVVMAVATVDKDIIAASLFFKDSTTLYGRYWGCIREYDYLHFELCYYQGIKYCIKQKLQRFDAGAQGEHKIARGFLPVKTYSSHWIADSRFAAAIADFVEQEAQLVDDSLATLKKKLPFKPGRD